MTEAASKTIHADLQGLVGQTIAERYRVDEVIGIGGMGAVFRGHHLGLKRDVAIKVLHPDLGRDEQISARFDREAHSASRLEHPNCLQVTDYGSTAEGVKYMVMQLLEGVELGSLLTEPLPSARAADLMLQILRGLEHAHDQGVIHRDLKPENVFITRDHEGKETLKLVDFGIAKIISGTDSEHEMTKVGLVFGTPRYMSPEQATGMDIDARSDLYSVGIIFYQMLAGQVPFGSDDPVALVRMQVSADPPPLPSSVPRVLSRFVLKLLKKDRNQRFQSAKEARIALEEMLPELERSSQPGSAIPLQRMLTGSLDLIQTIPAVGELAKGRPRRHVLAAAVAVVALLVLAAWWVLDDDETKSSASGAKTVSIPGLGGPPAEKLAEIDRLLLAGNIEDARKVLRPLRDEYPRDARLLWRQGQLFAKQKRKQAQALAAYGDAIDRDPSLLENRDFYAQLTELLRQPRLRDDAVNLALRKMGKHGHQFLLELVNREKRPLEYQDRHRALEELASDPENEPLVNEQLNVALDMHQAGQSLEPCKSYAQALDRIEADPDRFYLDHLRRADIPRPNQGEDGIDQADAQICERLPERRQKLLEALMAMEREGNEADEASADGQRGDGSNDARKNREQGEDNADNGKRKRKRDEKSSRCDTFGAALIYKECRK